MGPIDPIRPVRLVRRERPKAAPAAEPAAPVVNVTVNIAPPAGAPPPYPPPTNLDAHLIAQGARMRGLRGGQKVLETARAAYLETAYSGPNDRRAAAGRIAKTQA